MAAAAGHITGTGEDLPPYPTTTNQRYFWYHTPDQLDVWWVWLPAIGVTRWFWMLGVVFAAVSAAGWWHLRGVLTPRRDSTAASRGTRTLER